MIVSIRKGDIDFMYNGKLVRAWGDMCVNGFRIIASTIEWVVSGIECKLDDEERVRFIEEVLRYCRENKRLLNKFRIVFVDDNGKKIKKAKR